MKIALVVLRLALLHSLTFLDDQCRLPEIALRLMCLALISRRQVCVKRGFSAGRAVVAVEREEEEGDGCVQALPDRDVRGAK